MKREERNIMYSNFKAKCKGKIQIGTEKQISGIIHPELRYSQGSMLEGNKTCIYRNK
jgi:hypothetical protein